MLYQGKGYISEKDIMKLIEDTYGILDENTKITDVELTSNGFLDINFVSSQGGMGMFKVDGSSVVRRRKIAELESDEGEVEVEPEYIDEVLKENALLKQKISQYSKAYWCGDLKAMDLNIRQLEACFQTAIDNNDEYVLVKSWNGYLDQNRRQHTKVIERQEFKEDLALYKKYFTYYLYNKLGVEENPESSHYKIIGFTSAKDINDVSQEFFIDSKLDLDSNIYE